MDYFVSIENNPYHRWQVELLIESFKKHGLQDKLLIGIAENNTPQYGGFTRNLMEHERKFAHNNHGEEQGYKPLNKPYALMAALTNNMLSTPFAVLHPDMVLYKPLEETGMQDIYFNVERENANLKRRLRSHIKKVLVDRGDAGELPWLGGSGFLAFKNVSALFFVRVMHYMDKFRKDHSNWDDVDHAAWLMAMYELFNLAMFQGRYYECDLLNSVEAIPNACVIHYKVGVPPYFSKKHFLFQDPSQFTLGAFDPMDILGQYDQTTSMEYMMELVQSYKKSQKPQATSVPVLPPPQTTQQLTPPSPPQQEEIEYATPGPKPPKMPENFDNEGGIVIQTPVPSELIEPRV